MAPAKVQKASVVGDTCVLEVFAGRKCFLVLSPGRFELVDVKPPREQGDPPALQGQVRKELVPSILSAVDDGRRFLFARKDAAARVVVLEPDAKDPRWLLLAPTAEGERILATAPATRASDGRDLRRGRLYEPPRTAPVSLPTQPATSTTTASPPAATAADPVLQQLRPRLKAEIDRKRRLLKALQGDQLRHGDPARLKEDGELFKTVMGHTKRGSASVDVTAFDGTPRTLILDPARDARQNLERLFGRAKKARTALARTAPRIAEAQAALVALEQARGLLTSLDPAAVQQAVVVVEALLGSGGPSARRQAAMQSAQAGVRRAWRSFRLGNGAGAVVVRVGRGARDNDALVKAAKGNDLWLHARDATGAHVVIPSDGGPIADGLLRDAAQLTAWFSSARGERHVDVQHTRVKHLRKPGGGAPAGLFLVSHESVLPLRVDDERIRLLLAAEVTDEVTPKSGPRR